MTIKTLQNLNLAIGWVSSPLDSLVVVESSVLRTNPDSYRDAEKSAQRHNLLSVTDNF